MNDGSLVVDHTSSLGNGTDWKGRDPFMNDADNSSTSVLLSGSVGSALSSFNPSSWGPWLTLAPFKGAIGIANDRNSWLEPGVVISSGDMDRKALRWGAFPLKGSMIVSKYVEISYHGLTHSRTMDKKEQILDDLHYVLDQLMTRYAERVPEVSMITNALSEQGIIADAADIENDHIAFRTMGVEHLGIASLEKIFLHYGYTKRDPYYFEKKKLDAFWYAPPSPEFPRIFISELRVEELSEASQQVILRFTDQVTKDPVDRLDLNDAQDVADYFHNPLWSLPAKAEYEELATESEYAAWVIYNRYYLNHYTVSVHNLHEGYRTLEDFNMFVASLGVPLNNAGDVIKKSPDGLLLQSSTVANMIKAKFACGNTMEIPGSYVEFAERKPLPQFADLPWNKIKREHRREGFEANNADRIFESTFKEQTSRRKVA